MLTSSSRSTGSTILSIGLAVFAGLLLFANIQPPVAAQEIDDPVQDAVAIFNQAQEIHEKGDIAGAIALYKKALKVFPDFPEADRFFEECDKAQEGRL